MTRRRSDEPLDLAASRSPVGRRRRVGPGGRTTEFPPDNLSPPEAEARIADERREWMYVYASDGRQVARFRGTADNVDLSPELMGFTEDVPPASPLRDHLIVHNHPPIYLGPDRVATYPPSADDLALMVHRDLWATVVVSGRYRYVVRRPGDHWRGDDALYRSEIEDSWLALEDELGPVGPIGSDATRRQHRVLERLRERGWIEYERTDR